MDNLADYLAVAVAAGTLGLTYWRWKVSLRKAEEKQDKKIEEMESRLDSKAKKANGVPWAFIENLPLPAWAKDMDGKMLWINSEYSMQFGIKPNEYEGRTDYDVWPFEIAEKLRKHDLEVARSGLTMRFKEEVPETWGEPNSRILIWTVQKFPIYGPDGKITAVGGIASPAEA